MSDASVKKFPKRKRVRTAAIRTRKVVSDFPIVLCNETDRLAAELKTSRSAIIRTAVEEMLQARRRTRLKTEIDEYFEKNREFERGIMNDFRHVDAESR